MEVYGTILFRTLVVYIIIVIIFRIMGKREIGELGIVDFVVFILIAEMAAISIEQPDKSMFRFILPTILLVLIQMISAFIGLKSRKFRELVDGEPSIIIKNGRIIEKEMKKQRYNFDDLLMQLRLKDIRNISDVEFAILEQTGKLSVFKKEQETGYSIPIILEGKIQRDKLNELDLTEDWLLKEVKKKGFNDIKDISFCSYQNGELYIDKQGYH
jgi:uncharacterized membrane protein YcaP (DUF421 family)